MRISQKSSQNLLSFFFKLAENCLKIGYELSQNQLKSAQNRLKKQLRIGWKSAGNWRNKKQSQVIGKWVLLHNPSLLTVHIGQWKMMQSTSVWKVNVPEQSSQSMSICRDFWKTWPKIFFEFIWMIIYIICNKTKGSNWYDYWQVHR